MRPSPHGQALSCSHVGLLADEALNTARGACIEAVFDSSCYLRLDTGNRHTLVCLGIGTMPPGPINIGIAVPARSGWSQNAAGRWLARSATHPAGSEPGLVYANADVWRPDDATPVDHELLARGMSQLDSLHVRSDRVTTPCDQASFAQFTTHGHASALNTAIARRIEIGVGAMRRWLTSSHASVAPLDWPATLLGVGDGLTPAGDDILVGVLVALGRIRRLREREAIAQRIDPLLRDNTTSISAAHLRAAMAGYAAEPLHRLLDALLSGAPSSSTLAGAVRALESIGHSSGRHALAGALVVLDWANETLAVRRV